MKHLLILLAFIPFAGKSQDTTNVLTAKWDSTFILSDVRFYEWTLSTNNDYIVMKADSSIEIYGDTIKLIRQLFKMYRDEVNKTTYHSPFPQDSSATLRSSIVRAAVISCDKCSKVATELNFPFNGSKEAAKIFYADGWRNVGGLIYCGECNEKKKGSKPIECRHEIVQSTAAFCGGTLCNTCTCVSCRKTWKCY